eukprot:CAMPEP_0202875236 /NCGR_PEP_ID=MMETSP1391-20130828/26930_1 /ASSEMBLY_ACC=CAM_ASM_000867 /TAXON_ID=1034604 /ORGANISM="Chlamydomonas leiostraca, Strain SAG 11-49" /LENGTH=69 /DNA_ID=CAMNT_0049556871 /DNA_START=39 /DNA_END=244 /DNA_ORIENTATION=-
MMGRKELDAHAYQFLLTGGVGVAEQTSVARPSEREAPWLSAKSWGELSRAATMGGGLANIAADVAAHPG